MVGFKIKDHIDTIKSTIEHCMNDDDAFTVKRELTNVYIKANLWDTYKEEKRMETSSDELSHVEIIDKLIAVLYSENMGSDEMVDICKEVITNNLSMIYSEDDKIDGQINL